MNNYDLTVFSPNEFEEFSRDLLQKKLGLFIESFKTGKDGGIDLRFSNSKKSNSIIQAKRYKNYSSLIENLKKEALKVKLLSPKRYIITTTVGLSPQNKDTIKAIFKPYILNTEDVLGRDDLLNLLSLNPQIEEKYYKLWISSTTILEKILHSKIYNQSKFELDEIKNYTKLYVQNQSFEDALNILKKHRYIIISGIPGIGKTTLSRILTLYSLSNGYEEFIYLTDSIDDGYTYFKEDKKQIFLFDDFLGKNFFEAKDLQKNDDKIIKFIKKIKSSQDKILILVTREYILKQANESYEAFKLNDIEIAKCIIDLSTYTSIIKAKILYNHLFHGEIPLDYIENILENNNYTKLINHKNYNPRIIETIINKNIWNNCSPENFYIAIKGFFDNPESVWLHSFENSLDKFSQYTLLVLLTMGTPVLLVDLEKATQSFFSKNNYKILITFDSIKFLRSIRELENTFIKTDADSQGNISIEYQNPSIYDFLINYLQDKNGIQSDLIDAFIYTDQFTTIFTTTTSYGKILINENLLVNLSNRLIKLQNTLDSCKITKYTTSAKEIKFSRRNDFIYEFLNKINSRFSNLNKEIKSFVYANFQTNIKFDNSYDRRDYLELLQNLNLSKLTYDEEHLIDSFLSFSYWSEDLEYFEKFQTIFPTQYEKWIKSKQFENIAIQIINREMSEIERDDAGEYKSKIENLQTLYSLDIDHHIEKLSELEKESEEYLEHEINMHIDSEVDRHLETKMTDEEIITEIFNSLKE